STDSQASAEAASKAAPHGRTEGPSRGTRISKVVIEMGAPSHEAENPPSFDTCRNCPKSAWIDGDIRARAGIFIDIPPTPYSDRIPLHKPSHARVIIPFTDMQPTPGFKNVAVLAGRYACQARTLITPSARVAV